jgi:hypothetical protein
VPLILLLPGVEIMTALSLCLSHTAGLLRCLQWGLVIVESRARATMAAVPHSSRGSSVPCMLLVGRCTVAVCTALQDTRAASGPEASFGPKLVAHGFVIRRWMLRGLEMPSVKGTVVNTKFVYAVACVDCISKGTSSVLLGSFGPHGR